MIPLCCSEHVILYQPQRPKCPSQFPSLFGDARAKLIPRRRIIASARVKKWSIKSPSQWLLSHHSRHADFLSHVSLLLPCEVNGGMTGRARSLLFPRVLLQCNAMLLETVRCAEDCCATEETMPIIHRLSSQWAAARLQTKPWNMKVAPQFEHRCPS